MRTGLQRWMPRVWVQHMRQGLRGRRLQHRALTLTAAASSHAPSSPSPSCGLGRKGRTAWKAAAPAATATVTHSGWCAMAFRTHSSTRDTVLMTPMAVPSRNASEASLGTCVTCVRARVAGGTHTTEALRQGAAARQGWGAHRGGAATTRPAGEGGWGGGLTAIAAPTVVLKPATVERIRLHPAPPLKGPPASCSMLLAAAPPPRPLAVAAATQARLSVKALHPHPAGYCCCGRQEDWPSRQSPEARTFKSGDHACKWA